jgi:hypothetical protein
LERPRDEAEAQHPWLMSTLIDSDGFLAFGDENPLTAAPTAVAMTVIREMMASTTVDIGNTVLMGSLEAAEKKSLKKAFQGLRMTINDIVEETFHFSPAEVEKLDSELRSRGMITLYELRRRYSKDYAKIMKRGQIRNETEFYLLRNVLDDPTEKTPEERELLEKLISDYEGA